MKKRSALEVMLRLVVLVKPLIGNMVASTVMGLCGNLCATFITVFGVYSILCILGYSTPLSLKSYFICIMIMGISRGILKYCEQKNNHYVAFTLLAIIRMKVFNALRKLCPAKLEGKDRGDLISLITTDIELLEVFYAHTISPICIGFLFTVVMFCFIGHYSWILAFFALCSYCLVGIIEPIFINKLSKDNGLVFRNKAGKLSGFVLDSLRGLDETLQYQNGQERLSKMNTYTMDLLKDDKKMKDIASTNSSISNSIIYLCDLGILMLASYLYMNNQIGFDGLALCTVAFMSSFGPAVALAALGSTLQNTIASGNRVLDILDENPLVVEIEGQKEIEFDGIRVQDVTFGYEKEVILDSFNLTIPKNQIIGISGKSGSGKSTLLKLLMRFWQVNNGAINISNTNINCINTKNLRDMESFVMQETDLFHDSIKNNIKVAKEDATDEEVMDACKKASIHDFIMTLPKEYDTEVMELGDSLSGGERQRIGLARAFLHNSELLLLDEPTSNLDSLNEAVILKSLYDQSKNRTIVLVSHRLSTMKIADMSIKMESGRIS